VDGPSRGFDTLPTISSRVFAAVAHRGVPVGFAFSPPEDDWTFDTRRIRMRAAKHLCGALLLLIVGCVSNYDEFERDRRAYLECLDEHPDDPSACEDLRKRADKRYEDYEREAQRQWGCDQTPDRCNEPRPGQ
jgi:hypothetical protein